MPLILIVDDSALSRTITRRILQAKNHSTLEATNGREGIEIARDRQPDCILLDLLIPELNGFEFLEILQQENLKIPVIVITADLQETTNNKCKELGAFSILHKPPKAEELGNILTEVLELSQEETN
ncbi:response regulator receiver protein [Rippkaea orientalis PCC 8801]|uniref:Response regulator receiver protein n=1 Tax=Rippkaea orientalis (strain PCC 8801 / RF-1) TaxID=41431 RepID=B7JZR2_RIPO1|nr:response regulator [Rippkaea orientalis]ACK65005.1 response regulator receiver protein [Rippkaea orientalis PCC 8801]